MLLLLSLKICEILQQFLSLVTNVDKMRRKSAHKEAVEKTASPNLCTRSLEGKENDEVGNIKSFNTIVLNYKSI